MNNHAPVNLDSPPSGDIPELQLWREVFLLAIEDCRGQSAGGLINTHVAQRRARAWIFSNSTEPGGFKWCCEILGIDPRNVCRKLGLSRTLSNQ